MRGVSNTFVKGVCSNHKQRRNWQGNVAKGISAMDNLALCISSHPFLCVSNSVAGTDLSYFKLYVWEE